MRVLSLDPSSNIVGYCLMIAETERLIELGRLVGKPSRADADTRVRSILGDMGPMLRETRPDVILVELPLGKQYTRTPGKQSGMAVWGMAAGRVCGWLEGRLSVEDEPPQVIVVSNTKWTRGKSKADRQIEVSVQFPAYRTSWLDRDTGMDISDAIAMALWWSRRRTKKGLA